LTPASGKVGTKVTLSIVSSSFSLEGDYEVRWSPTATFNENKTKILQKGNVPNGVHAVAVIFLVPESRHGVNYVQFAPFTDMEPVNIQFIVEPHIEIIPPSTKAGDMVTIKGTGFPANDSGALFFDNNATNARATTNINGTFQVRFVVPLTSSGEHKLSVDIPMMHPDAGVAAVQVSSPEDQPQINSEQASPAPTTKTNSEIIHTPPVITDNHPPLSPRPIKPMGHSFGIWGANHVQFTWSEVSATSGVTYNLQISRNVNFNQFESGMQLTCLTQTSFAATLEPGIYYWRIKAIDGAGNESYWGYSRCAFHVGELSYLLTELKSAIMSIFTSQNY
jgi:hypothetical protein